jgi:hypothetical protein
MTDFDYQYFQVATCPFCRPTILRELKTGVFLSQLIGTQHVFCDILYHHLNISYGATDLFLARKVKDKNLIKFTNDSRRNLIKKINLETIFKN